MSLCDRTHSTGNETCFSQGVYERSGMIEGSNKAPIVPLERYRLWSQCVNVSVKQRRLVLSTLKLTPFPSGLTLLPNITLHN